MWCNIYDFSQGCSDAVLAVNRYSGSLERRFLHRSAASGLAILEIKPKSIFRTMMSKKMSSRLELSETTPPQKGNLFDISWYIKIPADLHSRKGRR